jgi:hypothetical protein
MLTPSSSELEFCESRWLIHCPAQICTISLSLNRCELAKRETFGDLFDTLDMASIQPPLRPRQVSTADCSGREPAESGHRVEGDLDPHMAYNEEGHYISAAACYIYNKYQASL